MLLLPYRLLFLPLEWPRLHLYGVYGVSLALQIEYGYGNALRCTSGQRYEPNLALTVNFQTACLGRLVCILMF